VYKPARPSKMVKHLQKILKEFNPCLQMHKLDLRRLKISSLFQKRGESTTPVELLDSQLNLVADYLNTSLNCIENNYNRHKTQLKNALTLLQPVSKEMGEAFEQFKGISVSLVENSMKEAPKRFDRYVRKTLEEEQHVNEYKEWQNELEAFQKENPSYPSFDEIYGKVTMKRKRNEDTTGSEKVEDTVVHDKMDIVLEIGQ
jgi:hypothetical protein